METPLPHTHKISKNGEILLQSTTLWRSNVEYWFFCASSSWDYAFEPFQMKWLCLEEFSSLEEEEYARLYQEHRQLQDGLCMEEFSSLEEHEYAQPRYIDETEKVLENLYHAI